MSLIDFYCSGSAAEGLRDYAYSTANFREISLTRDPIADINLVNPILHPTQEERIALVTYGKTWCVDNAIIVTGPSDSLRQERVAYWSENYTITLVSGIVSLVLGLGMGAIACFTPPVWLKVVCAVVAVVFLIFSALSFYRASDAASEVEAWSIHPTKTILDQRLEAYKTGLFYAMKHSLKEQQILHPQEVEALYRTSCDTMNRAISHANQQGDQAKAQFAEQFLQDNPLHIEAVHYAHGQYHWLAAHSREFETYRHDIQNIQEHVENQRALANKERDQLFRDVRDKETGALKPYREALQARNETCAANKKAALAALSEREQNDPDNHIVQAAKQAYAQGMAAAESQYKVDTARILSKFKQERERIERAHAAAIQTLEAAKNESLLPFFLRASDIFARAYAKLKGQNVPNPVYRDPVEQMRAACTPPGGPELNG